MSDINQDSDFDPEIDKLEKAARILRTKHALLTEVKKLSSDISAIQQELIQIESKGKPTVYHVIDDKDTAQMADWIKQKSEKDASISQYWEHAEFNHAKFIGYGKVEVWSETGYPKPGTQIAARTAAGDEKDIIVSNVYDKSIILHKGKHVYTCIITLKNISRKGNK